MTKIWPTRILNFVCSTRVVPNHPPSPLGDCHDKYQARPSPSGRRNKRVNIKLSGDEYYALIDTIQRAPSRLKLRPFLREYLVAQATDKEHKDIAYEHIMDARIGLTLVMLSLHLSDKLSAQQCKLLKVTIDHFSDEFGDTSLTDLMKRTSVFPEDQGPTAPDSNIQT